MARSNGRFLPLIKAAPLPDQGWQVRVISCDDFADYAAGRNPTPMIVLNEFNELVISPEIGDTGAGSLTLDATARFWGTVLAGNVSARMIKERQHLFVVTEDGLVRGEFLGQKISENLIDAGEEAARTVTISGPGPAQVLSWARVMSPFYPRTPPKNTIAFYRFVDKPMMAAYLSLLGAAGKRGTVPYVRALFTAAADSGKVAWEDSYTAPPSTTGYALLAGDVLFAFDSATLGSGGIAAVNAVADKVAKIDYPAVSVIGHADATGTQAYNNALALARAQAVADKIKAVIPGAVITVGSKGETQPVASNSTAAGRAKNRRVRVTYQKTSTNAAHSTYEPEPGANLLALLQDLTGGQVTTERSPIHVEWTMYPKFGLHVSRRIGRDRSNKVVFHEGSTAVVHQVRDRDRAAIANVCAVQDELSGAYSVATHSYSRAKWGQREFFQRLSGYYTAGVRAQIAATQRALLAAEDASWTVAVDSAHGRRPFYDFVLGDTIGLVRYNGAAPSAVETHRVMAISVRVGDDGTARYELRLESNRASRVRNLQATLDSLIVRREGVRTFISDDQPTGAKTGDLWTPPPAEG